MLPFCSSPLLPCSRRRVEAAGSSPVDGADTSRLCVHCRVTGLSSRKSYLNYVLTLFLHFLQYCLAPTPASRPSRALVASSEATLLPTATATARTTGMMVCQPLCSFIFCVFGFALSGFARFGLVVGVLTIILHDEQMTPSPGSAAALRSPRCRKAHDPAFSRLQFLSSRRHRSRCRRPSRLHR